MASEYDTVADALLATIQADSWLGDTDNIATIEVEDQESENIADRSKKGFSDRELPALLIVVHDEDPDVRTATVKTLNYWIPFTVFGITKPLGTPALARAAADPVIEKIEGLLRDQNGASDQLGIGALVHDIKSRYRPQREKNGVYGHIVTTGKVQHKVMLT